MGDRDTGCVREICNLEWRVRLPHPPHSFRTLAHLLIYNKKNRKHTMERKLASIQVISDLQPIPDADLIEVATINSWKLVVKKGEFKVGNLAIYCEIDSFLPIKEEFEFLRKSSYKKMGEQEGFRLKTIKLRGQVSQGLLMPLSMLPKSFLDDSCTEYIGMDVTEVLGIVKYEPPIPAELQGKVKGNFPSFIPKTDEERIQNMTTAYGFMRDKTYYETEKLDGSSATYYINDGVFGVCSRNLDLLETEDNSFWRAARELDLENKLLSLNGNYAVQGELIGEGIQGNPYKIKGQVVRFFNAYDIAAQKYFTYSDFCHLINELSLTSVPILNDNLTLPNTIDELLKQAEGKSALCDTAEREGVVIRSHDRTVSFKVISNTFLLKEN